MKTYTLKTKGNKSGPEKFIQRGRKGANGRFFTDNIEDAQSYIGFASAVKRAEEVALCHHISVEILENGSVCAVVSSNCTLTMLPPKAVLFQVHKSERATLTQIVDRVMRLCKEMRVPMDRLTVEMDLSACHSNGCPLDFAKLLKAPDFDFTHDVFGIYKHLDRETGKLKNCFLPRCSI